MKRTGVFYQLIYHFVWRTKNGEPYLTPTIEAACIPTSVQNAKSWVMNCMQQMAQSITFTY
jgi:hypothetical protein